MKNLKEYISHINEFETEHNSFDQMVAYFSDKDTTLPVNLCEGEVFLPSFILLKNLKNNYSELCELDRELNSLFRTAIHCSKLFYLKTIELIENESVKPNYKYEERFEKITQPLGQRLVNLLANIKYRIKIVELKKVSMHDKTQNSLWCLFSDLMGGLYTSVANIKYKITLYTASNHDLVRKFYYSFMFSIILLFWLYDYFMLDDVSLGPSIFLGAIFSIIVVLLAIISYPIGDFGKKDISGKNIVAYKYKVLLNNRKNSKIVHLFALHPEENLTEILPNFMNK